MKRLSTILFSALLPALAHAQTHLDVKVPDRLEHDLFGPVKSVLTEYSYNLSDRSYKEELVFDAAGNLLSRTKWDSKGAVTRFTTNTYDAAGCFVAQRVENRGKAGTNECDVVLNLPARKIALRDRKSGDVEIRAYSEAKYHLHTERMDKAKKPLSSNAFKRRPDHKETEYVSCDERGRAVYTVAFGWTESNLLEKELIQHNEKKTRTLTENEYLATDAHGNWTQCLAQTYKLERSGKEKDYEKFLKRTIEYHAN